MHGLNWVDIVLVLVIVASALAGLQRGLIRGALDLAAVIVSVLVAAYAYHRVADLITARISMSEVVANIIAFALLLAVVQFAFSILVLGPLTPLIWGLRRIPLSKEIDGVLGVIPGAIKGVVLAAAIAMVLVLTPLGSSFDQPIGQSRVAAHLLSGANQAIAKSDGHAGINLADIMLVSEPDPETGASLPFRESSGYHESEADEQSMLAQLNQSRLEHGLAPLRDDPELRQLATAHSEEMLNLGYFSHISPVSGSPADRVKAAGITFTTFGENIAYAPTIDVAQRGLMRSESHRANILSPDFTRVGIGVIVTSFGTRVVTQEFAGP
ncbi:MAG TPA: CvpA family protein [Nitrolancea sp.]|nr:CvpA family protein [Nitrolancea sp.]